MGSQNKINPEFTDVEIVVVVVVVYCVGPMQ